MSRVVGLAKFFSIIDLVSIITDVWQLIRDRKWILNRMQIVSTFEAILPLTPTRSVKRSLMLFF